MAAPCPTVVLISGSGSNLQALIEGQQADTLNISIQAVISNKAEAYGLKRAAKANIPSVIIDHKAYDDRHSFDAALRETIDTYQPSLIVLAGFMRILTPEFVRHYSGRMLNIHPSLLPKYQGLNTHQRALDAGDDSHGATVHFVTEELDGGTPSDLELVESTVASRAAETMASDDYKSFPIDSAEAS